MWQRQIQRLVASSVQLQERERLGVMDDDQVVVLVERRRVAFRLGEVALLVCGAQHLLRRLGGRCGLPW